MNNSNAGADAHDPLLPLADAVFAATGLRRTAAMRLVADGRLRAVRVGKLYKIRQSEMTRFTNELEAA